MKISIAGLCIFLISLQVSAEAVTCDKGAEVQRLKESIRLKLIAGGKSGYSPAVAYQECAQAKPDARCSSDSGRLALKAELTSQTIARAVSAALDNPEHPGTAAASTLKLGKAKHDSEFWKHCALPDDGQLSSELLCGTGAKDLSISSTQVFENSASAETVAKALIRSKLTSTASNEVKLCAGTSASQCQANSKNFATVRPDQHLSEGETHFFRETTSTFHGVISMNNRYSLEYSPIEVCGQKVYVVLGMSLGSEKGEDGFDHATLVGIVGRFGNKTVTVGDFTVQSFSASSGRMLREMSKNTTTVLGMLSEGYSFMSAQLERAKDAPETGLALSGSAGQR